MNLDKLLKENSLTIVANETFFSSGFTKMFFDDEFEVISTDKGWIYQNSKKQLIVIQDSWYEINNIKTENSVCFTKNDMFNCSSIIYSNKKISHLLISFPLMYNYFYDFLKDYDLNATGIDEEFDSYIRKLYSDSIMQSNEGDNLNTVDVTMWLFGYADMMSYNENFSPGSLIKTLESFIVDEILKLCKNDEIHIIDYFVLPNICSELNKQDNITIHKPIINNDEIIYKIKDGFETIKYNKVDKNTHNTSADRSYNMKNYKTLVGEIIQNVSVVKFNDVSEQYFLQLELYGNNEIANFRENIGEDCYHELLSRLYYFIDSYTEYNDKFVMLIILMFKLSFVYYAGNNFVFYFITKTIEKLQSLSNNDDIKDACYNFKQFLLDVYTKYSNIEKPKFKEYRKYLLTEYNGDYFLSSKNTEDLNSLLKMKTSNIFESSFVTTTGVTSNISRAAEEYIFFNKSDDFFKDKNFNKNLNLRLLVLSKTSYIMVRILEKEKDSNGIMDILHDAESIISFILKNHTFFSPELYQRIVSLISFKNNVKIRYNQDHNMWNMEELIDTYLDELMFIFDNKYYFHDELVVSKMLDELSKVQNLYNKFKINKTIKKQFDKGLLEFSTFQIMALRDTTNFNISKEFIKPNESGDIGALVDIHKNNCNYFYEIIRPYLGRILCEGHNLYSTERFNSDMIHKEDLTQLLEKMWMVVSYNGYENKAIYHKNNSRSLKYVY